MRSLNSSRAVKSQKGNFKSGNDPAVEGVFRIIIQRSLKEMVDLPELKVWSMLPRTVQARMVVRIRRYGFFFTHDSEETLMRCVLTRRNYLIIYAKEKQLKGYAVKLSLAEKINIACGRGDKGRCSVTIKWQFGDITLTMLKDQIADWRSRILEAFEGTNTLSMPATQEVGIQTMHNNCPSFVPKKSANSIDKILENFYKGASKNVASTTALAPNVFDCHLNESKKEIFSSKRNMGNSRLSAANAFVDNDSYETTGENDVVKDKAESEKLKNEVEECSWSYAMKEMCKKMPDNTKLKMAPLTSAIMTPMTSSRALCMRRSISSPSFTRNKFNGDRIRINSPPIFGPRKVTFPKRSISRIDRPLMSVTPWVPPQSPPWCSLVKRYDFPKEDAEYSDC